MQNTREQDAYVVQPPTYTPGEFNRESIYELLVAELAGQQGQFDLALNNYIKQARLNRDPAIAERATRVAQYLRSVEGITEAAGLWIETDPENAEPYQISASILLHQKRYEEAMPLVERALEFDRPRMLAVIRGQIPEMPNEVISGYINLFTQLLDKEPNQTDVLVTQGLLYKQQKNLDAALDAYETALAIDARSADAIAQKAELLRLRGQFTQALQTLAPALKSQPDNQSLMILNTQLLFQSGQIEKGVAQAQEILAINNKDYQLKFYLALLLLENNRGDDAQILLNELLEQNSNDTRPYFYLGTIAQQQGQIDQAIDHYLKVDDPATTFQAIGRVSALLDSPEDRERLTGIIGDLRKTRPDLASQLYTMEAEWLNLHNFTDDALVVLEEALTRYSDDVNLLYTRAMMLESIDFARAEEDLRKILEIEPDSSLAMNALGYTLTIHTERYEEAYELIAKALEIRPNDPAIIDSMGWVLFKLQRYEESIQYLQRAYDEIKDGEVIGHLVRAYWANGDKQKARALLDEALAKDPDNSHLQEAAQAIGAR
ncbi:tetratricopeptide repeat protein [Pontibacterium sp.]|uniref:tetratricopeptide repeat protein n=1 Tax=Pontibacterium sp. TaxID=2036026 RepID=UPI003516A6CE